jgi:4-oxalocrotonate tautomerase
MHPADSREEAMPILDVKFSTPIERDLRSAIASTLSSITARVLRKKQELTAVVVDQVDPRSWFVGGPSLAEQHKASFFLDIRVVDGTNLKDEKADYLREIFAAMEALLGPLHPESYIHVHDVRADAYGYGGLTQELRYIRSKV